MTLKNRRETTKCQPRLVTELVFARQHDLPGTVMSINYDEISVDQIDEDLFNFSEQVTPAPISKTMPLQK